jgi:dihydrofolate synthase/folylpolyglutamate synthase
MQQSYQETLDFLYAQLPMYQRVGASAYKKDLGNTLALCAHLGNPQQQFPTVHIAGTNGKGSVTHLMAAACQAAGLKTGMYVSPHYKDFRERIKINGTYIPKKKVVEFVSKHKEAIQRIQPSFFELCVAMAFQHFAEEKVDIAIIEVGLGGRLDSTNVIQPLLSIITNISFDHMDLLGNTLPLIAGEKAGIIKAQTPVVIGETHPETRPVFEAKAAEQQAPIWYADQEYQVQVLSGLQEAPGRASYQVYKSGQPWGEVLQTDAVGPYQQKNLATALKSAEILGGIPAFQALCARKSADSFFPQRAWEGFFRLKELTRLQGRWQQIGSNPTILCDSAHNEAGLSAAFQAVAASSFGQLHIVTGFVNDKDLGKALRQFPSTARYYFAKANIPRGLDAYELQQAAAAQGLKGKSYSSVKNALKAARRKAAPTDLILVIGSIFVVAEVI